MTGYHHLGDALTVFHHEVLLRQIDQHHADLSAIVGIDGAGGVQYGDTFLQGESAARAHLCLIACGQRDVQPSGYQPALQGAQRDGGIQVGSQVHARTLCRGVLRQGLMAFVDDFYSKHTFKISF